MKGRQGGFTLLEVLVALAIFAVSALVIMEQTTRSVHQQTRLEEKTIALWIAENNLAQLRLDNHWPNTGNTENIVNTSERSWRVQQQIENTANESLRKVTIIVSREASDASLASLIGYVGEH